MNTHQGPDSGPLMPVGQGFSWLVGWLVGWFSLLAVKVLSLGFVL